MEKRMIHAYVVLDSIGEPQAVFSTSEKAKTFFAQTGGDLTKLTEEKCEQTHLLTKWVVSYPIQPFNESGDTEVGYFTAIQVCRFDPAFPR